ncbi:MAG: hypothetical protein R3E79_34470 [Caldilineaceae bacterium]
MHRHPFLRSKLGLGRAPKPCPRRSADLVGAALALADSVFQLGPTLAALLCALLLQVGSNFANNTLTSSKGPTPTNGLARPSHRRPADSRCHALGNGRGL